MYIKRNMENSVLEMAKMYGAVLVTGSRQVGKTTLLQKVTDGIPYVTLDDPIMRQAAIEEPSSFLQSIGRPVFIDEIQYAPTLFPYIKIDLDKSRKKGVYFMSGSQQFHLMKDIGESLAGRLGILNLHGLSLREISGMQYDKEFIPTSNYFTIRSNSVENISYKEIWNIIHRGSMPQLYSDLKYDWSLFYGSYVRTYIERDVRNLTQISDELKFLRFMTVMASMTGQLLNLAIIAKELGISEPTAKRWLSILVTSNIVYLLKPFYNNITKRAIKTPKLYFLDTGLAAYLTRWSNPEVLQNGAMAGSFFETFVISEIIKSYSNIGILDLPLYYYRDKEKNEIDLLIYKDGTLHPLEIKKSADPKKEDIRSFSILDKMKSIKRGEGGLICLYDNLVPLKDEDKVIPVTWL
jgi:predicted AAA+ superfamily ATPase